MTLFSHELRKLIGGRVTLVLLILLLVADVITCAFLNKPNEVIEEDDTSLTELAEQCYHADPQATLDYYLDMEAQNDAYLDEWIEYTRLVNAASRPSRPGRGEQTTEIELPDPPVEPIFAHTYSDEHDDYEVLSAFFGKAKQASHYKENTQSVVVSVTRTLEYLESFEGYAHTYTYREQLALLSIYLDLHADYTPTLGIVKGWGELFAYQEGSIFLLLAVLIVGCQIVLTDYTGQMTPILRTTKRGRFPTAFAKLCVGVTAVLPIAALFTLAECVTVAWRIGLSNPFVAIQNIEGYLYCPYPLTIFTALLWQLALRFLASIAFLAAMLLIARLTRRPIAAYAAGLLLFAVNILLHFFKTHNQFFSFNAFSMASGLAEVKQATYFDLFGEPYTKLTVMAITSAVTALLVGIGYLVVATFHRAQPSRSPIRLHQMGLAWVRSRLHIEKKAQTSPKRSRKLRSYPLSLFFFEAHKHLRTRTVVLIVLIALIQFIFTHFTFSAELTPNEVLWESYLTQYSGELTDESAAEIRSLARYYDLLRADDTMVEVDETLEAPAHDLENGILRYGTLDEYITDRNLAYLRQTVTSRLAAHVDYLEEKAAETGVRGWLIKDTGLNRFMGQPMNVGLYLLLLLILSELFGYEGRFTPILRITQMGRGAAWRSKLAFATAFSFAGSLLFGLADWLCFLRYFDLADTSAPLYSIADYANVTSTITVGQYLILLTVLRIAATVLLGLLVTGLSGVLPSARVTLLTSGTLTLLPLALYYCGIDFMRCLDFTKLLSGDALWLLSWVKGSTLLLIGFFAVTAAIAGGLLAASYRKFCK